MDNKNNNEMDTLKEYLSYAGKEKAPVDLTGNIMKAVYSTEVIAHEKRGFFRRHSVILITFLVVTFLVTISVLFTESGNDSYFLSLAESFKKVTVTFPAETIFSEVSSGISGIFLYISLGFLVFFIIDYIAQTVVMRFHGRQT